MRAAERLRFLTGALKLKGMGFELLKELLEQDPFLRHVGVRVKRISRGECEVEVDLRQELTRFGGIMNGGAVATLADAAGGCAVLSHYMDRNEVTVDLEITYMRPISEGPVVAHGRVLKAGRSLAYVLVEVRDGKGELAAVCKGTYFLFEGLKP